ncbi:hypothetical protein D3C84_1171500 [compost metagenome]
MRSRDVSQFHYIACLHFRGHDIIEECFYNFIRLAVSVHMLVSPYRIFAGDYVINGRFNAVIFQCFN